MGLFGAKHLVSSLAFTIAVPHTDQNPALAPMQRNERSYNLAPHNLSLLADKVGELAILIIRIVS